MVLVLYGVVWNDVAWDDIVQYCMAWHGIVWVWYGSGMVMVMAWYGMAWCSHDVCMVRYGFALQEMKGKKQDEIGNNS